jgi:hypothetical protein
MIPAGAQEALDHWQRRLRLGDWIIRLGDGEPEPDERSHVDMHTNIRQAVILLRSDTPASQVERQVVHELLHVRLVLLERAYIAAKGHAPRGWDDSLWDLGTEAAIEALCDAVGCRPRADWGPAGSPFNEAFPPDISAGALTP